MEQHGSDDPAGARALEQREHTWALGHEAELLRVLRNSSDVDQRQVASEVLGYAKPSREQIVALDYASDDPDSTVRNNATRALMVLLRWNPDFAAQLNTQKVIAMLGAGKWTDRNKAVGLLEPMTQQRDQKLLAMLRTQALEQLVEMAKWTNTGHAYEARLVLGRIAGLPEGDVRRMASTGQVEALVNAARKKK